mmetsp:Transcript_38802/g.84070  ORF Transcript_38802/g.84070 Transcript_38802/m.84070 type:complete len:103 (-) Transcript_38802:138-446(-)
MTRWMHCLQLSCRPRWTRDTEAVRCADARCDTPFSLTNRRHHCRNCGQVFCGAHSDAALKLTHLGYDDYVRCCDVCVEVVTPFLQRKGQEEKSRVRAQSVGF